jgi:hypothetical protein
MLDKAEKHETELYLDLIKTEITEKQKTTWGEVRRNHNDD